jgi:Raf kinase inhibitor-like YbhB/YbcL family protein
MERLEEDGAAAPEPATLLWVVFNIPSGWSMLPEGPAPSLIDETSGQAIRAVNHFGAARYDGPCPPTGEVARYAFRIFALRTWLEAAVVLDGAAVYEAMQAHVLARGELIGTFGYPTR